MTDSYRRVVGRRVVSRASAQDLGALGHLLFDGELRQITAIVVGSGKKARLIEWDGLSGFGPDAIMVRDEGAMHLPGDEVERDAAGGRFDPLGKRVLTELGTELGHMTDVTFDADTGAVNSLLVGEQELPVGCVLSTGSYASVVDASREPST